MSGMLGKDRPSSTCLGIPIDIQYREINIRLGIVFEMLLKFVEGLGIGMSFACATGEKNH
jgi:hypothetical protein